LSPVHSHAATERLCDLRSASAGWEARRLPGSSETKTAMQPGRPSEIVSREATVFADEHGSYNDLAGLNELQRVNHSKAYQTDDGTNTNQVESFFSRVQRAYVGIHHPPSVFVEVLGLVRGGARVA